MKHKLLCERDADTTQDRGDPPSSRHHTQPLAWWPRAWVQSSASMDKRLVSPRASCDFIGWYEYEAKRFIKQKEQTPPSRGVIDKQLFLCVTSWVSSIVVHSPHNSNIPASIKVWTDLSISRFTEKTWDKEKCPLIISYHVMWGQLPNTCSRKCGYIWECLLIDPFTEPCSVVTVHWDHTCCLRDM